MRSMVICDIRMLLHTENGLEHVVVRAQIVDGHHRIADACQDPSPILGADEHRIRVHVALLPPTLPVLTRCSWNMREPVGDADDISFVEPGIVDQAECLGHPEWVIFITSAHKGADTVHDILERSGAFCEYPGSYLGAEVDDRHVALLQP